MAMPFIVDRVRERAHHAEDSIVAYHTFKEFEQKFEEEFNELFLSGSDDELLPAKLNSLSVDELLYQVALLSIKQVKPNHNTFKEYLQKQPLSMKFLVLALTMVQDGQPTHCGRNFRTFSLTMKENLFLVKKTICDW